MAGAIIKKDQYSDTVQPGGNLSGDSRSDARDLVNQGMGAQRRASVQLDTSAGDGPAAQMTQASMGQQRDAAAMLRGASSGPSAATAQGQAANASALSAMLQARAGGGSLARSLGGGAAAGLANAQQVGATRAGEVASRSNAYAGAMGGVRASDQGIASVYGQQGQVQGSLAGAQGKLSLDQQQLNDQFQQASEMNAFDVNRGNMNASLQDRQRAANREAFNVGDRKTSNENVLNYTQGATTAVGNGLAGYATTTTSDERTKKLEYGGDGDGPGEPGEAKAAMQKYDREKASERAGVRPRDLKPGGKEPELASPLPKESGYPNLVLQAEIDDAIKPRSEAPQSREDLKRELASEDSRARSKRRGVTPYDIKEGGKNPELASPMARGNEYPGISSMVSPDTGVLADANRKMAGEPYTYKGSFVPPDEEPGQKHYGYMAQNLEKNPVTATAVVKDQNGVRQVHQTRMLQAVASGVSDLQKQIDEMRGGKR